MGVLKRKHNSLCLIRLCTGLYTNARLVTKLQQTIHTRQSSVDEMNNSQFTIKWVVRACNIIAFDINISRDLWISNLNRQTHKVVQKFVLQKKPLDVGFTYLSNLYLKGSLWITEVCSIVFDGFIASIKSISTFVTVPVWPFEFLFTFYSTYDITVVTASQNLQAYNINSSKLHYDASTSYPHKQPTDKITTFDAKRWKYH